MAWRGYRPSLVAGYALIGYGLATLNASTHVNALAATAALYLPVMFAFWFAPPLAAWHSTGPVKALFFSFAAALMNWRAFLGYGAVTGFVTLVLPFLLLSLLALVSGGVYRFPVASLVLPLLIVLLPTLFASFYVSYRDVSPAFLKSGVLDTSLFSDPQQVPSEPALHPSPEGQERMAAALEPTLSELLGDARHDR